MQRMAEAGISSALAMLPALGADATISTFDVIPWRQIQGSYLMEADFADRRLWQINGDVGVLEEAQKHIELFRSADLIFVDGPKDGVFEQKFLDNIHRIGLKPGALLLFDDIRVWRMLDIWRRISHPKLDLTGFGHWTGTGLVEWLGGNRIAGRQDQQALLK